MLRQLLTLLALITGLAATSAPAVARAPAADGAQIEVAEIRAGAIVAELETLVGVQAIAAFATPRAQDFALPAIEWRAPAVLYGPDRAHE